MPEEVKFTEEELTQVQNIQKSSDEFDLYETEAKINLVNNINTSYDFFLNDKYQIKINQKTLERVKNYFK